MKYFLVGLIKIYQLIPGPWHASCRHIPTCSNYGIDAIRIHGSFKGVLLILIRVLKCNPLTKSGIDLVPRKEDNCEKI